MQNRIRELREARGWSMRALGDKVNTTGSNINKLEKGQTVLDVKWIERFAKAFDVTPADIIGQSNASPAGDADDVAPIKPDSNLMQKLSISDNQSVYAARTGVLDQIGIVPRTVLVVDTSPAAVAQLESGDAVIAEIPLRGKATIILRQFIEPSLLITNSTGENGRIINLRTDDVAITGVVVGSYGHLQRSAGRRTEP